MRIDLQKFLFIGLENNRKAFFAEAQEAGFINFIDMKKSGNVLPDLSHITASIKILRGLPTATQEQDHDPQTADSITAQILQINQRIEKLLEEKRLTRLEIARISIFGNFSLDDIKYIEQNSGITIQYFFGKQGIFHEKPLSPELFYVGSEHALDYFVSFSEQKMQFPKLVEMKIDKSLDSLKKRLHDIDQDIHDSENELKSFSKYNSSLHHALVHKVNSHNLNEAIENVDTDFNDSLFVVSGWVPVNKINVLKSLIEKYDVHAEEISPESNESVPTYLENKGLSRMGEDLVHIYDTPSNSDNDPSLWVLFSFAFFFSFIVGDGGYGLIFLLGALFMRFKNQSLGPTKKRLLNLATFLCISCVVWGLLTSSFFGISLSPDNPLRKYSAIEWLVEKKASFHINQNDSVYEYWVNKYPNLKNISDPAEFVKNASEVNGNEISYELMNKFNDNIMIELAMLIGVVHIILSMCRYLKRNWVMAGWIAFIIGGYLYFPRYLDAASMTQYVLGISLDSAAKIGLYLMIGGLATAMLISILKNKLLGLLEFMTAIQVFGDILSYLRLYALGLAGAIVSATINDSAAALPFIVGVILIFLGHAINIVLAIMSGVIHGLRLNFLEWYHYSFEGGGKIFKPLKKLKIE